MCVDQYSLNQKKRSVENRINRAAESNEIVQCRTDATVFFRSESKRIGGCVLSPISETPFELFEFRAGSFRRFGHLKAARETLFHHGHKFFVAPMRRSSNERRGNDDEELQMLIVIGVEDPEDQPDDVSFQFEASGNFHRPLKFRCERKGRPSSSSSCLDLP